MARAVFWSTAGAACSRGIALLTSIVMARLLGKQIFGELGIVQSTVNMFATFAVFGMGLTATRHVAKYRLTEPSRAGRIIGMSSIVSWFTGGLMGVVVFVIAPWLVQHALGAPQLTDILRISGLLVLLTVVNEAQTGSLSGLEAFRRRSIIQSTASLIGFPVAMVGVYFGGLVGAVWGLTISQGVLVYLNSRGLSEEARNAGILISWTLSREEFRVLWGFSVPTLLGSTVYVPAMWLANAIIVSTPNGYEALGVFSAADRWRTAIIFLPGLLGGVALPLLSNLPWTSGNHEHRRILWTNAKLSFLFSVGAATPIIIAAPWIMAAYGPGFTEGRWILVGLCVVAVISGTSWILIQSIVSQGRMWLLLFLNLVWAVLLVGCCWMLRARGATGLLAAYLLAEGTRLMILFLVTRLSLSARPTWVSPC
jgi:O-antigen/teichoic acid export membrane protein